MKHAKLKRMAVLTAMLGVAGILSGCGSSSGSGTNGALLSGYSAGLTAGANGTCILSFTANSATVTGLNVAAGVIPYLGTVGGPITAGGPTTGSYVYMTSNGSSMQLNINNGYSGYGNSVSGVVILSALAVQKLIAVTGSYGGSPYGGVPVSGYGTACPNVSVVGFSWSYAAGSGQLTAGNTYFSSGSGVIPLL